MVRGCCLVSHFIFKVLKGPEASRCNFPQRSIFKNQITGTLTAQMGPGFDHDRTLSFMRAQSSRWESTRPIHGHGERHLQRQEDQRLLRGDKPNGSSGPAHVSLRGPYSYLIIFQHQILCFNRIFPESLASIVTMSFLNFHFLGK